MSSFRWPYVVAVAVVLVVALAGFLALEFEVAKAQATQEHTAIESFVNDQMDALVFLVGGAYSQAKDWTENRDDYAQKIADLRNERNDALMPMVNTYYDQCEGNIDSYLDWYYGIAGGWAKFLKPFGNLGGDDAVKTFKERITQGTDADAIQREYRSYQERINQLVKDARLLNLDDGLAQQLQAGEGSGDGNGEGDGNTVKLIPTLDLWQPLSGWGSSSIVKDTLLNTDENVSRDEMREKLLALIETARSDTMDELQRDIAFL